MSKKKNLNSKSFKDVKITDADIKKYAKKLSVVSKGKAIGSIITGVALVGAGVGAATYFAVNKTAAVEGAGTIIVDPSIEAKDAIISSLETDTSGNKVSTVTSETRIITDVVVSVGSKTLVNGVDYSVTPRNEAKSDLKVTIYKETYEKYSSQGAFRITPQFAEKCLIIFDTDGGSDVQPISVEAGQKATKPSDPTKEGYEFLGWWYTNDQGQYVEFDFDSEINSNLILHAKWDVPVTTKGIGYHHYDDGYYVYCNDADELPSKIKIPETYTDPKTNITDNVVGFYYLDDYSCGFSNCLELEEVILPDTICEIDECAFYNCVSLKKINIPNSVIYIDSEAFEYCFNLESINLPEGLSAIYNNAFAFSGLKSVVLPESLGLLQDRVFYNCSDLKYAILNEGINSIYAYTFANCKNLVEVVLPYSLSNIQEYSFLDSGLNNVIFKDEFSEWTTADGKTVPTAIIYNYLIKGTAVSKNTYYSLDENYMIQFLGFTDETEEVANCAIQYTGTGGEDVTTIPEELYIEGYEDIKFTPIRIATDFDKTKNGVSHLKLNSNITSIAPKAFYDTYNLKKISFDGESNLKSIGDYAFAYNPLTNFNSESDNTINLPESLEYLGNASFCECPKIENIQINSNIDLRYNKWFIDSYNNWWVYCYPFAGCSNVKNYSFKNNSYYKVDSETSAIYSTIDGKINELVAYPSLDAESDENIIKIAEGAKSIWNAAFCFHNTSKYATKISIPSSLETFNDSFCYWVDGDAPFLKLKSFDLANDNQFFTVDNDTLFNKDKTELIKFAVASKTGEFSYELPDKVTTICDMAFYGSSLSSINLDYVQYLNYDSFACCINLTSVKLTNIKEIGEAAFYNCNNLADIHIGESCTYVYGDAFSGVDTKTGKLYIDSSIIANYTESQWGEMPREPFNDIYVKEGITVKDTSYIGTSYDEGETESGYVHYTKN